MSTDTSNLPASASASVPILKVDYREKALIALLQPQCQVATLDIGDIQIVLNDKIEIIFERKTLADLHSSVRDGRYHEQKARVCSNVALHRFIYILEGDLSNNISKYINIDVVYSAMLNTMFRDGIGVYKTSGVVETTSFLREIFARFTSKTVEWCNYLSRDMTTTSCLNIVPDIKVLFQNTKKSANINPSITFTNMLAQIPGCSTKLAQTIVEKYASMNLLVQAYHTQSNTKSKETLLKDIPKIGPVLSKRIYHYLFDVGTTES
jgi:ERCC4-type nuclease